MFSETEKKWYLGYVAPLLVAHIILGLCGYKDSSFGAPINGWIIVAIYIGNQFYWWKNKKAFLLRCLLALPFALLITIIMGLTAFGFTHAWVFGILMFILLTVGKEESKQMIATRLVIGVVLISFLSIMILLIKSGLTPP